MPGKSRTARRYESVDTKRSPSPSAARSTPVRIGRESSPDAAFTTCLSASDSAAALSVTPSPSGWSSRGKSSAGIVRIENSDRPAVICTSSPSTTTSTAPGLNARTMSAMSLLGITTTPSVSPETVSVCEIVRSRSDPVTRSASPERSRCRPESAILPVRPPTARPVVLSASRSTSRSHRNFIVPHLFVG